MGSYTQIAATGAKVAARRRRTIRAVQSQSEEAAIVASFRCPRCGDSSIVEVVCDRCQVTFRGDSTSVALVPPDTPPTRQWPAFLMLAAISAIPILTAIYWPVMHSGRALEGPVVGLVSALPLAVVGLYLYGRLQEWFNAGLFRRRLRRRLDAVPEALAVASDEPVRVAGTVRIERDAGSEPVLWLETDDGRRVRLPTRALRAGSDDGPRSYVRVGEHVEVVGRVRVALGSGSGSEDSYRDSAVLELEGDELVAWVRAAS